MLPALTHYSHEHVRAVHSADPQRVDPGPKPRGFWVSVDEGNQGWADWCRGEDFNVENLNCVHDVTLRSGANVLVITGASGLDDLTAAFGAPLAPGQRWSPTYILWHRVAALYGGIIIAPYIWSRRLNGPASAWYYGWDCASGCIWDASVIERITLRSPVIAEQPAAEALFHDPATTRAMERV